MKRTPVAQMLIRQPSNDVVSRDTSEWTRPDWQSATEECRITWTLRDGTVLERIARVEYAPGEREQAIIGMLDKTQAAQLDRKFFELKARRWKTREAAVADLEREYREHHGCRS